MSKRNPQSNFSREDMNPCIEESNISLNCLQEKDYDYSQCAYEFLNYKRCKQFWGQIFSKRKQANIKPFMPTKSEREKIMAQKVSGINVFKAD